MNGNFTERFHSLLTSFICSLLNCEYSCSQVTPSFFSCLFTNSRLCCTHLSYHWCKICNVLHQLMQITKRQCDPCFCLWICFWINILTQIVKNTVCIVWDEMFNICSGPTSQMDTGIGVIFQRTNPCSQLFWWEYLQTVLTTTKFISA